MERIKNLVKCPETHQELAHNAEQGFKVIGTDYCYRVRDGILDFTVAQTEKINEDIGQAYDKVIGIYDDYMNCSKPHLGLLKRILLGMGKEDTAACTKLTKELISKVKKGYILELPVGTGIFTIEEYVKHPEITFVAVDYSWGMLQEAKKKVDQLKARNVLLVRADVGRMPFKDEVFDGVLTLNGVHSFPDKALATKELARVLKKDQSLFGSICIKGERWLTDLMMELYYFPGKWFTRPALSKNEFLGMLKNNDFKNIEHHLVGPGLVFRSTK